ncbi:unnamed protein product [Acanthoscelides obtectus]|nr:unnamed protein product [Acanthoscelides obtectus]CAK1656828.1 Vanin-like protein 3 [Acanthoscelides obtectus]
MVQDQPERYAVEIPDVGSGPTYSDLNLQRLANAAREHGMYVVVNILEKANDTANKTIYYNTNFVLNNHGKILAKYRKINLFLEPLLTPGAQDQKNTFQTDFNEKFGMFICFDILFYYPSRSTIASGEIKNVIFTTAWFSTVAILQPLNVQHGYAVANRVNLLASNMNNVTAGNGGSGIYGSNGAVLSYYISGLGSSRLLISKVGSNVQQSFRTQGLKGFNTFNGKTELDSYITQERFDSNRFTIRKIELSTGVETVEKVCQKKFCCEFNINAVVPTIEEVYQLVAYDGEDSKESKIRGRIRICALMVCDSRGESCASRSILSTTKFLNISVHTEAKNEKEHFYQPVTLRTKLTPLEPLTQEESINEDIRTINVFTKNNTDIILFGLYGRSSGSTIFISSTLLVFVVVFRTLF